MHSSFRRNKPGEIYRTAQRFQKKKKKFSKRHYQLAPARTERAPSGRRLSGSPRPHLRAGADRRPHSAASMCRSSWTRKVTPWAGTSVQRRTPRLRDSRPNQGWISEPLGASDSSVPPQCPCLNGVSLAVILCPSRRGVSGTYGSLLSPA